MGMYTIFCIFLYYLKYCLYVNTENRIILIEKQPWEGRCIMSDFRKNKFESNKKYFTISIYVIIVIAIGAIIVNTVTHWNNFKDGINKLLSVLNPFLIGAFIAYLLNPMVKKVDSKVLGKIFKNKQTKARKYLAISITYIFSIGIIAIVLFYILPQLFTSISNLIQAIPRYYNSVNHYINTFNDKYPNIDLTFINDMFDEFYPEMMKYLRDTVTNFVPVLFSTSISVIRWVLNIIIAIIVSCYMLSDKKTLLKNFKRVLYACLKEGNARICMETLKECNNIFGGFIIGKTIDSTIIGVLCFLLMTIFKMPYALLISVIIGITNMIPYFGPFIGAIPGFLLLVLINPVKAIIYLVLVIVLQQFDGLYLGPKILGISTGLKPLWIIFAITLGGSLAGIVGMFFGVPIIAVITYIVNKIIERKLKEKNITIIN